MSIFNYYASLRSEILEIVTGVENSGSSLFWDETTPNWVTKDKLENLYKKYLNKAKDYGLYVVTMHSDCPNPKHSGYPISNDYGIGVTNRDQNYVWNGGQIYQGPRYCRCPCSPRNKITEHWVIDTAIYEKSSNQEFCKKLELILLGIYESIECAGDKKPRAAIRENLLRAVLRINDELLPEPMDIYIQNQIKCKT